MRLETAREVVHAGRSTLEKAQREVALSGKFEPTEKNGDNKKRKNRDRRRSPDAHQKKAKSSDQRVTRPPLRKYNNFTDLTRSCKDVFLAIEHTGVYKGLDMMRGDRSKSNQNKYCRYH